MALPSREVPLFQQSGWYADLGGLLQTSTSPDYDYSDFSKALRFQQGAARQRGGRRTTRFATAASHG